MRSLGMLAGVLAFGLAYVIGEPQLNAAIAVEDVHSSGPNIELIFGVLTERVVQPRGARPARSAAVPKAPAMPRHGHHSCSKTRLY